MAYLAEAAAVPVEDDPMELQEPHSLASGGDAMQALMVEVLCIRQMLDGLLQALLGCGSGLALGGLSAAPRSAHLQWTCHSSTHCRNGSLCPWHAVGACWFTHTGRTGPCDVAEAATRCLPMTAKTDEDEAAQFENQCNCKVESPTAKVAVGPPVGSLLVHDIADTNRSQEVELACATFSGVGDAPIPSVSLGGGTDTNESGGAVAAPNLPFLSLADACSVRCCSLQHRILIEGPGLSEDCDDEYDDFSDLDELLGTDADIPENWSFG
jgi:hypothetical protein